MLLADFINNRKKLMRDIFPSESMIWINNNINYDIQEPKNILQNQNFMKIVRILKNIKKITTRDIAKICLFISYSYIPSQIVKDLMPTFIIPASNMESNGLVKYYIKFLPEKNSIFVTFRGTKTFWEAINGLKFYRVSFDLLKDKFNFFKWRDEFVKKKIFDPFRIPLIDDKEIEVHKGFLDETNSIYKDFIETILPLLKPGKKINIILTGHSLGGVLVTIMGVYLGYFLRIPISNEKVDVSIITLNTPPCGNKNFNLLIPYLKIKNYVRFYNYQDFIPYYGYYGSWIESKKFRHLDFMLKSGINQENDLKDHFIYNVLGKTKIWIKDFGKNIDYFINKNIDSKNEKELKKKYIYHDFVKFSDKDMALFI